jgi:hypothetical protein
MAKKTKQNAVVLTARDLLNGFVANNTDFNLYNMTPLQMIPEEEKDDEWKKWNLDWLERAGMRQLHSSYKKISKNYHLANGVIDKTDYMIGESEASDHISAIVNENDSTLPLKFYPIIPNVINILVGEFSKRDNRIIAKAVDEFSVQEAYDYKKDLVTQILTQQFQQQKLQQLSDMGVDIGSQSPQVQKEMDMAAQLAQAETKFRTYRGIAEKWANHVLEMDDQRFDMYQKEIEGFRDMLVSDREFWHVCVKEDDYKVELWNPKYVFYHKSPDTDYISEGNYVGRIRVSSIPDVIDMFGDKMTEEQVISLKDGYSVVTGLPLVDDAYKDRNTSYTNYSKPYPEGINNVTWQKHMDKKFADGKSAGGNTDFNMPWADMKNLQTDYWGALDAPGMVRVTEAYWKSQRKVGKLVVKDIDPKTGESFVVSRDIVDESFKVTVKPVFDKSIDQVENERTCVKGEYIEWIWINEVRYGVKINSTSSNYYGRSTMDFDPIYIGGEPIPFQFKGQDNLYGCKLPVEGRIFSERNSHSSSLVDKMKAYQIMFNVLNNQIMEMLADDIGNVIVLDQNMIPRNSLGGEWGKHNYPMFHQVMKDYSIAPIDPSIRNTEGATNFSHFQSVDLSKTEQLLTRIKIAEWVKDQALLTVGITPQRQGSVAASESATGVQQAVNNSYAQTEPYFDVHMNHLMPRVRQMMIDAAQFITATKPQSRLTYMNSQEENVFFQIEGYRLLLRDFMIHSRSTADIKAVVEQMKQVLKENNTAGGSLYDIVAGLNLNSPAEIIAKLKEADDKRAADVQAQRDHDMQMQQEQQKVLNAMEDKKYNFQFKEAMLNAKKDIAVAQIRASQSKTNDVNGDKIPDPLQALDFMEQQKMNSESLLRDDRKLDIEEQKIQAQNDMAARQEQLKREEMASKERMNKDNNKTALKNKVSGEK